MNEFVGKYAPVFTIGTVAKMLDVSVQTIRMYEQEGLILPAKTETGRRMYSMQDVERLDCIRKMIVEKGLNIKGIRKLMSLIPCWEFKGGLDDECKNCEAYYDASGPCWSLSNVGAKCSNTNCRECPVYRIDFSCGKLKEIIYGHKCPEEEVELKNNKEGEV
jgi:MerR family transcriptional regulator/heat shock protein HspR